MSDRGHRVGRELRRLMLVDIENVAEGACGRPRLLHGPDVPSKLRLRSCPVST